MFMKIMVIIAHPQLNDSRANRALMLELGKHPDIHARDLYQEYPHWDIDVEREQRLLLQYDRIVLQFPLFWYSSPPLLKKWFDDVFTHGWAYGPGGDNLEVKEFMIATTTGGTENQYRSGGINKYTISELLRPMQRTVARCGGTYLPAFVVYNVTEGSDTYVAHEAEKYVRHIKAPMVELVL